VAITATRYQAGFWMSVACGIAVGALFSAVSGLIVSHVREIGRAHV